VNHVSLDYVHGALLLPGAPSHDHRLAPGARLVALEVAREPPGKAVGDADHAIASARDDRDDFGPHHTYTAIGAAIAGQES